MGEQPHGNIGLVSDDGKWRWDGATWQPNVAPPTASQPPLPQATPVYPIAPPTRRRGWIGYVAVAVVALIVGGLCGSATASSSNQNAASHSSSSATQGSSAPSAQSLEVSYAAVVTNHAPPLEDALNQVANNCGASDLSACRTAIVAVQSQDRSFLTDLGKLSVPACLAPTNEELATAIELELDGSSQAIEGIDANDASEVTTAAGLISLGTTHLDKATALLKNNPCG